MDHQEQTIQVQLDALFKEYLDLQGINSEAIPFALLLDAEDTDERLLPGDHIFFPTRKPVTDHHAIYMGRGIVIDNNDPAPGTPPCIVTRR